VTSTPSSTPRAGCPDLESLAALAEGRLVGAARAAVLEHLADCDDCRELVVETLAITAELAGAAGGGAAGTVVPFPEPKRPGRARWIAAAAGVAVLATAIFFARGRTRTPEAALAELARQPGVTAKLGADWNEPLWSVTRGEGPVVSERARAFRLGVRSADLDFALAAGERVAARRIAAESALLVADVPLADPVTSVYRDIAQALATEKGAMATYEQDATTGRKLAREAVDPGTYDLGRWAETLRLAATSGASLPSPRFPGLPQDAADLAPAIRRIQDRTPGGSPPPAAIVPDLEHLIAAGGDLR